MVIHTQEASLEGDAERKALREKVHALIAENESLKGALAEKEKQLVLRDEAI